MYKQSVEGNQLAQHTWSTTDCIESQMKHLKGYITWTLDPRVPNMIACSMLHAAHTSTWCDYQKAEGG